MSSKTRAQAERCFRDNFLDELKLTFENRRKAIRYSLGRAGEGLSIEIEPIVGEAEQLTICGDSYPDPLITLAVRSNTAALEIRRSTKKVNGKVILRLEDLRLVRNPLRIVEAYEKTVSQLGYVPLDEIKEIWAAIELTPV